MIVSRPFIAVSDLIVSYHGRKNTSLSLERSCLDLHGLWQRDNR